MTFSRPQDQHLPMSWARKNLLMGAETKSASSMGVSAEGLPLETQSMLSYQPRVYHCEIVSCQVYHNIYPWYWSQCCDEYNPCWSYQFISCVEDQLHHRYILILIPTYVIDVKDRREGSVAHGSGATKGLSCGPTSAAPSVRTTLCFNTLKVPPRPDMSICEKYVKK